MKVVAVLYPGGAAAAETPELLGCAENALGCYPRKSTDRIYNRIPAICRHIQGISSRKGAV